MIESISENIDLLLSIITACLAIGGVIEFITRSRENREAIAAHRKPTHNTMPPVLLALVAAIGFIVFFSRMH